MPLSPPTATSLRGAAVPRRVTSSRCGVRNDADLSFPPAFRRGPSSLYRRDRGFILIVSKTLVGLSGPSRVRSPSRPSPRARARPPRRSGRRPLTGLEHLARRAAQSFGVPPRSAGVLVADRQQVDGAPDRWRQHTLARIVLAARRAVRRAREPSGRRPTTRPTRRLAQRGTRGPSSSHARNRHAATGRSGRIATGSTGRAQVSPIALRCRAAPPREIWRRDSNVSAETREHSTVGVVEVPAGSECRDPMNARAALAHLFRFQSAAMGWRPKNSAIPRATGSGRWICNR
jgi:hypothetical protein